MTMNTTTTTSKISKILPFVLLIIIIVYGFNLRIWDLGSQSLWIDEGFSINASSAVLEHGYPLLDSGEVYKSSYLHIYTTALSEQIFGHDPYSPWGVRIPSVLFGVGVIFITYLLTHTIFNNRKLALAVAAIVALSTWEIEWSRQARGYMEMQFFFISSLWFFWQWLSSRKFKYLIGTIITTLCAILSHILAVTIIPILILTYVAYLILNPQQTHINKKALPVIIFSLLGAALFIVLPELDTLPSYTLAPIFIGYLLENLKWVSIAATVGIFFGIFDKRNFWAIMFLTMSLIIPLIIIFIFSPLVQMRYIFLVFPIMIILGTYGIWRLVDLSFMKTSKSLHVAKPVLLVILSLLVYQQFLTFTPTSFYHVETDSPRPDFSGAYKAIQKNLSDDDIIISPYAHLNQLYLGDRGYWLPISLTGKKSELEAKKARGFDFYTGAPMIENTDHLLTLFENESGYLILDEMAKIRLNERVQLIESHPEIAVIYSSHQGSKLNGISVYRFE